MPKLRLPPKDIAAEKRILRFLINNPSVIEWAKINLNSKSFYYDLNSEIYEIILGLHSRDDIVDIITVSNLVEDQCKINREYLKELKELVVYTTLKKLHEDVETVLEKKFLREICNIAIDLTDFAHDVHDGKKTIEDLHVFFKKIREVI